MCFRTKSALLQGEILLKRAEYIRFPNLIDHNNGDFKGNDNFNKTIELITLLILNNYLYVNLYGSQNVLSQNYDIYIVEKKGKKERKKSAKDNVLYVAMKKYIIMLCNVFGKSFFFFFFGKTIKAKNVFQRKNTVPNTPSPQTKYSLVFAVLCYFCAVMLAF